jgi:GNAT superfamily N-acetyltransferase
MLSDEELVSAVRRSDEAWCAQLATAEPLDFGVAYAAVEHPDVAGASQLRDVWLAETSAESAYAQAEAYFSERGLRCDRWVPASGQAVDPVEGLLASKGWRRVEAVTGALMDWEATSRFAGGSIKVLPARAMKRAYRSTFEGEPEANTAAGVDRLNDAKFDGYVALCDGAPAGRAACLEVGDIARLADLFVIPEFRRRGVGGALAAHFVQIARRISPRAAVTACAANDAGARAFVERCGFACGPKLAAFERGE